MKIRAVTKARTGFAIAFGIPIGVVEAKAIAHIDVIGKHVALFCWTIAGVGLFIWFVGQLGRGSSFTDEAERKKYLGEHPFIFLRDLRYWGMILIVVSGATFYRSVPRQPKPMEPEPKVQAPMKFPPLQLEGVVLNGAKSSAMINGQVLFIGEGIGNVQLLAVDGEHATVGLGGQTKILTLPIR